MNMKTISVLVVLISLLTLLAAGVGVCSNSASRGPTEVVSIYGERVLLYGQGLYRNMSAGTARDGIAQDIVTMVLALPLLLCALSSARKGQVRGRLLLAGTLVYFLFTYSLYLVLTVFNEMFLVYVMLSALSLFALVLTLLSLDPAGISARFQGKAPIRFVGGFLVVVPLLVALMWLGRIIPALVSGAAPVGIEHYTTLPVQALDLAFMHPLAILTGVLLLKRRPFGYLLAPLFTTFLTIMMAAIAAKVVGQMLLTGLANLPIVIVFSVFALVAMSCTILLLRDVREESK